MNLLSKLEFVNTVTRCSDVVLRMFGARTRAVDHISSVSLDDIDQLAGFGLTQILRRHLCRVDYIPPHK